MKIEKMINIRFTEGEIKEALLAWMEKNLDQEYYAHILANYPESCLESEDGEIVLIVNGAIEESVWTSEKNKT
jgi:hypothetical protein